MFLVANCQQFIGASHVANHRQFIGAFHVANNSTLLVNLWCCKRPAVHWCISGYKLPAVHWCISSYKLPKVCWCISSYKLLKVRWCKLLAVHWCISSCKLLAGMDFLLPTASSSLRHLTSCSYSALGEGTNGHNHAMWYAINCLNLFLFFVCWCVWLYLYAVLHFLRFLWPSYGQLV